MPMRRPTRQLIAKIAKGDEFDLYGRQWRAVNVEAI